jgi:phage terminase large subunit GpA-like protein
LNFTRNANGTTTIECTCGYIATFKDWQWICPDCGRGFHYSGQKNGKPHLSNYHVPEHLVRAATERRKAMNEAKE